MRQVIHIGQYIFCFINIFLQKKVHRKWLTGSNCWFVTLFLNWLPWKTQQYAEHVEVKKIFAVVQKNSEASTGFELMTSTIPICSANQASLEAGQERVQFILGIWREWYVYMIEIIYMNCRWRVEVKVIFAVVKQLKQLQRKPRKNSEAPTGFEPCQQRD